MRLLIINPNSTASMTDGIAKAARAVAARETQIEACNPFNTPPAIQGEKDGRAALPGLFRLFDQKMSSGDYDAVIIACFDDTGLMELKAKSPVPVLGIGEAAYLSAMIRGTCFAVVTTLSVSVPVLEQNLRDYGFMGRCAGVFAADIPVLELESDPAGSEEKLDKMISRVIEETGCDCVVLGCAGMAAFSRAASSRHGLPVLDGVTAAVALAQASFR